jgi:CHAT domain-containing protein
MAHVLVQQRFAAAVGALWEIDDASAREVSRELHQRLTAGVNVVEAIRGSQLALLGGRGELGETRVWAAMIGVGTASLAIVNPVSGASN